MPLTRRQMLASMTLPALQACAEPLPPLRDPASADKALALLAGSAAAHGLAAYGGIIDISVSYAGQWRALVGTLQPDLVDAGFRGQSQERLLLQDRLVAQTYEGPHGEKHVVRRDARGAEGSVTVWFNGDEAHDTARPAAAALVADGYMLFLLGPMLLTRQWAADRTLELQTAGSERIVLDGHGHDCDVVRIAMQPGIGLSSGDDFALFIDRQTQLMRRVRFTLNGLDSTRGAIAQVDTFDHVNIGRILWPTRFHEHLLRPLPLAVHDWRMTGLDLNRGLTAAELIGPALTGKALVSASPMVGAVGFEPTTR